MDRPNVQVSPPGICQSDWTVSYSVYGDMSSASAKKVGSTLVFDASVGGRPYHHQSREIPEYFSITRRSKSGNTYDVKVKYDGENLDNYF